MGPQVGTTLWKSVVWECQVEEFFRVATIWTGTATTEPSRQCRPQTQGPVWFVFHSSLQTANLPIDCKYIFV